MPDKPGKIDWKKRLEGMRHDPLPPPPQSAVTSTEPPVQELFSAKEVPVKQPEPKPGEDRKAKPAALTPEPPVSLPEPQMRRLEKLERQMRSLKIVGLVASSLAIVLLIGLAVILSTSLKRDAGKSATGLTINDPQGTCRVWLGERDGQVRVELRDQKGLTRFSLGLNNAGDPRLIFYHKDQTVLTEIVTLPNGQPGIQLLNQAGEPLATIPAPALPAPGASEPQMIAPLPTPIPQPAPQVGQESAGQAADPSIADKSELFVASPGGKAYHLPSCPWVKNIPLDKLLKFSSATEAVNAGFHPCRRCRPDHKH